MAKRSKIEQLPPELKDWLDSELVRRNFSNYAELAAALKEQGEALGLEADASRSGLHRYGSKLERRMSAIKASTEAAKLIAASAPDDEDARSNAIISLIQTELFEAIVNLQEAEGAEAGERVGLLSKAAKNIATLARASVNQKKHMIDIRAKAEAAVKQVSRLAKKGGLSADVIQQIEEQVLGITR